MTPSPSPQNGKKTRSSGQTSRRYVNKWVSFSASLTSLLGAGLSYAFALYAGDLKQRFRYSQRQTDGVAAAMNLGGYLGVPAGLLYDALLRRGYRRAGPRVVMVLGALVSAGGYLSLWRLEAGASSAGGGGGGGGGGGAAAAAAAASASASASASAAAGVGQEVPRRRVVAAVEDDVEAPHRRLGVLRRQPAAEELQLGRRVEPAQRRGRGLDLWRRRRRRRRGPGSRGRGGGGTAGGGGVLVQHLAVQVADVDAVAVAQAQLADSRRGQVERGGAAEPAEPDDEGRGGGEAGLGCVVFGRRRRRGRKC